MVVKSKEEAMAMANNAGSDFPKCDMLRMASVTLLVVAHNCIHSTLPGDGIIYIQGYKGRYITVILDAGRSLHSQRR